MRMIEADAKRMLARRGLSVPTGTQLVRAGDGFKGDGKAVAVKAQVLQGNRAGAGLIELVDADGAAGAVRRVSQAMMAAGHDPIVLVEHQVPFTAEYYAAWRIDDLTRQPMLLFSRSGGTGIESRADEVAFHCHPVLEDLLPHKLAAFLREQGVPGPHIGAVARYCASLYEVFRQEDALLLEINPLVITEGGQAMALDAKMILDDYSRPRHLEWHECLSEPLQSSSSTPLEAAAAKAGFTFVELPGRVAVFSAGAGLGMCLTDVLADAGIPAANFCDATGGAGPEKWASMARIVFERARSPEIEAVLVFFTLTATSIKSVLSGLFMAMDGGAAPKPMVVGLMCAAAAEQEMSFAEVRQALAERGYACVTDMAQAVQALQKLMGKA